MKKRILSLGIILALVLSFITPPQEAKAAGASAIWGMNAGQQYFSTTNNTEETLYWYVCYVDGDGIYSQGTLAPGQSASPSAPLNLYLYVTVQDIDGVEYAYALSAGEHQYQVVYNMQGQTEVIEDGYLQQGDSFNFTADSFWVDVNGGEWLLAAGESQSKTVAFGTSSYTFNYVPYDPGAVTASVTCVDEYGNILKRESKSIQYDKGNGSATFEVKPELEINGRKYEKDDTIDGSLIIKYTDDTLNYEILYRSVVQEEEGPYTVTVEYREVNDNGSFGNFLGNTYFTHSTEAEKGYEFTAPDTIRIRNQETGTETYYQAVQNASFTHDAKDANRLYTVGYQKFDEKSPYNWSVRLVDAATGKILDTQTQEIAVDGTGFFQVKSEISSDGKNYIIDSKMEKEYTHKYNEGSRILNIYYHEENEELPSSYNLNVQYMSVSDNTVLYSAKATATAENGGAEIASPASYSANDTEYVRLSGQGDVVNHDFYSGQRTYTIYYRDVNDLQNVDTVVTQEDVVTSENLIDDGTQTATVLTNQTTGATVTLNDEGVPLAQGQTVSDEGNTVTLEDEEVPLAKGKIKEKGILAAIASHPFATGIIIALVLLLSISGYFFWKKKNKKEEIIE